MNSPTLRHAWLPALLPACILAQTVAPAPATSSTASTSTATAEGEAVKLSPFEVNTSRDTGFAAASSMAGGRLATDLRDTPVAYSVITRDFIDALNLTDLQSAAEWTTSSTVAVDNGQQNFFFSPVQYNVRGAGGGRPQRNFFPQFNNGDSYTLERYDFGRGPNAVLFGNGSLGGISSSTTKRAQTNRRVRQFQLAAGSWQNLRGTVDVNQPINDKLAMRAAGVWGDAGGWRHKDFDKRDAVFLTTTLKPWRNGELRVEGEYGTNSRQVAVTFMNDRFSGWDGTTYNAPRALATLPANAIAIGVNRRGANYFVCQPFVAPDVILNYQNDPITVAGGNTATTPIAGYTYANAGNVTFNTAGANLLHDLNIPANRFANAERFSEFRRPAEEFTLNPDLPILTQRFKDLQLTFHQRWGNLHFEIAGDINRTAAVTNGEPNRDLPNVYIDINRVLPDGRANPNFLVPYGDGQFMRGYRTFTRPTGRPPIASCGRQHPPITLRSPTRRWMRRAASSVPRRKPPFARGRRQRSTASRNTPASASRTISTHRPWKENKSPALSAPCCTWRAGSTPRSISPRPSIRPGRSCGSTDGSSSRPWPPASTSLCGWSSLRTSST